MVHRRALATHRRGLLSALAAWLAELFGEAPRDEALYLTALTHPSFGADNYQRLAFLGCWGWRWPNG